MLYFVMGTKVSRPSSSKGEAKALSLDVRCNSIERSSIIEAIKPQCLKKRKKMKKNQMKRSQLKSPEKRVTRVRTLTLEDWLVASPGPAGLNSDSLYGGGELHVFKHVSRRVYPSSSREPEDVHTKPGDSFSMDISIKDAQAKLGDSFSTDLSIEDVHTTLGDSFSMDHSIPGDVSGSSFSRSQSGKMKKKVSFRLPEEADIVIFHSPA